MGCARARGLRQPSSSVICTHMGVPQLTQDLVHPAWPARYTGITTSHIDGRIVDPEEVGLFLKERQSMQWQVDHFQHIVSRPHHTSNKQQLLV